MSNDVCGAECVDGSECQNPAGSCGIPSHSDPEAENPHGRPSIFTDELAREAIDAATTRYSYAGIERAIGVGEETLNGEGGWLDQDLTFEDADGNERNFSRALERARGDGEEELIQGGLYDDEMDTSMAKFLLATSYGHKKTEAREVTGDGGGPVQVEFTEEIVETSWGDDE